MLDCLHFVALATVILDIQYALSINAGDWAPPKIYHNKECSFATMWPFLANGKAYVRCTLTIEEQK